MCDQCDAEVTHFSLGAFLRMKQREEEERVRNVQSTRDRQKVAIGREATEGLQVISVRNENVGTASLAESIIR